jgi:hypothetical protein
MKIKAISIALTVIVLFTLIAPAAVLAQDEGIQADTPGERQGQRPAPSLPLSLADTIVLPGSDQVEIAAEQFASGPFPPTDIPSDPGPEANFRLLEPDEAQEIAPDLGGPDGVNACAGYLQNWNFQAASAWKLDPAANVRYSGYGYQSSRSMYMATTGRKTAFLWQQVTVPAGISSLFVRFKAWQRLEPGETAWVAIWDANFKTRLWYAQVVMTQNRWGELYWWINPLDAVRGKTVNLLFTGSPDTDATPSDLGYDDVELAGCATPAPTSANTPDPIDLQISYYGTIPAARQESFKHTVWYAADAIYEMSNGRHYIRNVTFHQNRANWSASHVQWDWCLRANADLSFYRMPKAGHIRMADLFPNPKVANPCAQPQADYSRDVQQAGYTLAHELGHYFYGLYDEYAEPGSKDISIWYSVMSSQHCARPNRDPRYCGDASRALDWLNFSHSGNFNVRNPNHTKNYQYYGYLSNAWDTLVRHPEDDRGWSERWAKIQRPFYPRLATVAPRPGEKPSIQLADNIKHSAAAAWVRFDFRPALANAVAEVSYVAEAYAPDGNQVKYPEAAMIVATIARETRIARATVSATVTAPYGAAQALLLRDDGVAPDEIGDDGRYSAIMPYNQNGSYAVTVAFSNPANAARYTDIGKEDVPWELGSAVGENFAVTARATVIISGYTGDDYADTLAQATTLYSDNVPKPGQIDRPGDRDSFSSTLNGDGAFVLRLSSFAQGMRPTIRLWHPNGQELLGEWTIEPKAGYYYFIPLKGVLGNSFYTEILHADPGAAEGMYALSFGRPLPNEAALLQDSMLFLPYMAR